MEKETTIGTNRQLHPLEVKYGAEPKKTKEEIDDEWRWH